MKVINLFSGPGGGKSTTAAGLFFKMKLQGMEVELVTEYAKDLVWSERHPMFTEQDYITAKQNHRLRRLRGKVDYAITDSPLVLAHFYMPVDFPGRGYFGAYIDALFSSYDNLNIFLIREKPYNPNGRNQTEEEARAIDFQVKDYLISRDVPFFEVPANSDAPDQILKILRALK